MEPNNGINNYKGVMLCSRPNQNAAIVKQKVFCARVVPPDKLGLVPTKKFDQIKIRKKKNPVLDGHKRWLQDFKRKVQQKKQNQQFEKQSQIQRLEKIKQEGAKERAKMLSISMNAPVQNKVNGGQSPIKIQQKTRRKDDEKPAWAQTQQQIQKKEQKQVDDLIDFFNNTDIQKYIDQVQIASLMKSLKQKIQEIKKEENWKQKNINRYRQKKIAENNQVQEDKKTNASKNSVSKSVASQKTTQRIQELKEKLQKKNQGIDDWDKHTKTSKHSYANIQQKIAKNVADDIIRNYGNIKNIHSNQSVRKMLEREAAKQLIQTNVETKQS